MKPRLINMFTLSNKLIIDQPKAPTLVECNRPAMNHRVPIMFRDDLVKIITRLPLQHSRLRFVADHKRSVDTDRVLLESIDLYSGMIRSRTKLMPLREVRGVNVRSWIDDDCTSPRRHFDTQHIIVPMRSATVDSCVTRVEAEIKIILGQNVSAGVCKHTRTAVPIRWAHSPKRSHALFTQNPEQLFRRLRTRKFQPRIVEGYSANRKQVRVIVCTTTRHRQHLTTIRIANQRRKPVRSQIRTGIDQHLVELVP